MNIRPTASHSGQPSETEAKDPCPAWGEEQDNPRDGQAAAESVTYLQALWIATLADDVHRCNAGLAKQNRIV